jgi:hypothetical protein
MPCFLITRRGLLPTTDHLFAAKTADTVAEFPEKDRENKNDKSCDA